jgi:hypothetical protein
MRRYSLAVLTAGAALVLSVVGLASAASASPVVGLEHRNVPVCAHVPAGVASCDAIRHDTLDRHGKPLPPARQDVLDAQEIRSAYGLTGASSGGRTVAVVDAYDAPTAEADLAVYRAAYGLPTCTSDGADPCFAKVNQRGGATPPAADPGWAQEISLDLDMVSAACPDCRILLVEADSSLFADLAAAVDTAAGLGAVAISNSYGGSDVAGADTGRSYDHPGIAITASTGDGGYGVSAPASFGTVVAVGGTSLRGSTTGGWSESAWSGAGSGCSRLNTELWQDNTRTGCAGKATADVSAVADPDTGVSVYDSYDYQGAHGWLQFGGTSASSPIVAGIYAMGTAVATRVPYPAAYTWAHATGLTDVRGGSNGRCRPAVWCTAGTGWDGPTGLGTPKGTGAF